MLADLGLDDVGSIGSEFSDENDPDDLPEMGGITVLQVAKQPIKVGGAKSGCDSEWDSTVASDTQTPRKLPDTARVIKLL